MASDPLIIGEDFTFQSRLMVGTGKYPSNEVAQAAIEASGAEVVTVAVRRVNLDHDAEDSFWSSLDLDAYTLLPNTAGCYTADDAIRTAMLGREVGFGELVKLEVIGDEKTLFPDNQQTLDAAKVLLAEGFKVLPYVSDDIVACKKLQDIGCPAVMPLGAPIGSGLGIRNPVNIRLIKQAMEVPVIVDAGVGTASDVAIAPWRWAMTRSCSTRPSPRRPTRCSWLRPCGMPAGPAALPIWRGASLRSCTLPPRAQSKGSSSNGSGGPGGGAPYPHRRLANPAGSLWP